MLSTAWLVFFAVVWWVYTPHDGRVQANSAAQKEVMESGKGHNMSDEERALAAMTIWNAEKGVAAAMLVLGWVAKVSIVVAFKALLLLTCSAPTCVDLLRSTSVLVRDPLAQGLVPLPSPHPSLPIKRGRKRLCLLYIRPSCRG